MRRVLAFVALLTATTAFADPPPVSVDDVRSTIERGAAWLVEHQNPNGSWGSHHDALLGLDDPFLNQPAQKSFAVATTALCCSAIQKFDPTPPRLAAYDRGLDYVLANFDVKRISEWDIDNTWGYVYGLQGLVDAYGNPRLAGDPQRRAAIADAIKRLLERFRTYQTPLGGWGYYDVDEISTFPANWATSFMTSAAVLAQLDARRAGFDVDAAMMSRAVRAVRRCRLPSGAYTYDLDAFSIPAHGESINNVKGSLGRIQVCNLVLHRADEQIRPKLDDASETGRGGESGRVYRATEEELRRGLDVFFREHRFLDIAKGRPIPHEAYYANAAYFYFFGHYYAALVIAELPKDQQGAYWRKLQQIIVRDQQADGSMVDYYMNNYGKPYGTAFGLLTLVQSLAEQPH